MRNPEVNATASGVSINHPNMRDLHSYLNTSVKIRLLISRKEKRLKLTEAMQTMTENINNEDTDEDFQ